MHRPSDSQSANALPLHLVEAGCRYHHYPQLMGSRKVSRPAPGDMADSGEQGIALLCSTVGREKPPTLTSAWYPDPPERDLTGQGLASHPEKARAAVQRSGRTELCSWQKSDGNWLFCDGAIKGSSVAASAACKSLQ